MKTTNQIILGNSKKMSEVPSGSISLVVTSPPYPMIEMWDDLFCSLDPRVKDALDSFSREKAFELMHKSLDPVWKETFRVLRQGGIACINIGDATRNLNGDFKLYSNHARILHYLLQLGFNILPNILWRKQTNAPNKFMGSGMLPGGAYVTLEHEHILIIRKGGKREFAVESEKVNRRKSAIFWEERNIFFSDIWMDIKGTRQGLSKKSSRLRSGAYPFELVYRLISMYSAKNDTILDPFLGTGTTMAAAMVAARNCVGYEIDPKLKDSIYDMCENIIDFGNQYINARLEKHMVFVAERLKSKGPLKHNNMPHGFPVITSQEKELTINEIATVKKVAGLFEVSYLETPRYFTSIKSGENLPDKITPCKNKIYTDGPGADVKRQLTFF